MINIIGKFFILLGTVLFLLTIYSFFNGLKEFSFLKINPNSKEEYSAEIGKISSMKEFKDLIKMDIKKRNLSGIDIPILIDDYVRKKFQHGNPTFYWYENWFLNLLNLIFPQYFFNSLMDPKDIIKSKHAMCSQQSIVFQDVIKDYNFDYGSLRFNHFSHFASAVKVNNKWYFFDSNMEPKYDRRDSEVYAAIFSGDLNLLKEMYDKTYLKETVHTLQTDLLIKEMFSLSDINKFPAPYGVLVQNISSLISWYGWIFFLCFGIVLIRFRKKNNSL